MNLLPGSGNGAPITIPGFAKRTIITHANWVNNTQLLVSQANRLVQVATDGSNPVTLVSDPSAFIVSPQSCNGGRSVVFSWVFHAETKAQNIWRADADGSNQARLTEGKEDQSPVCSPDGRWVYFGDASEFRLMRVPINGGTPEQVPASAVPNAVFFEIALSRDGEMLAFIPAISVPATQTVYQKLALVKVGATAERAPRLLDVDARADGSIQFTPDGKAVAYVIEDQGVGNIWVEPLDGSKGRQITNFTSEHITNFHWSPDGKSLALLRTETTSDVILLRASQP